MMEEAGIQVALNLMAGNDVDAVRESGGWDWTVRRGESEVMMPLQRTTTLAPVGPITALPHRANADGEMDLMPFQEEMVEVVNAFIGTNDGEEKRNLMKDYQRLRTENLYDIGLTHYPGALIINKRFANLPNGTPINMFNWAEDAVMRERLFVPEDQQSGNELYPTALPGEPGGDGPITAV